MCNNQAQSMFAQKKVHTNLVLEILYYFFHIDILFSGRSTNHEALSGFGNLQCSSARFSSHRDLREKSYRYHHTTTRK